MAEAQRLSCTGSFGWNVSSKKIFWSEESFRIFGYEPTCTPTIDLVIERVYPEDLALVRNIIARASRDGTDWEAGRRLLMPDGEVKDVHVAARAGKDEIGNLEFVGALIDVTEATRAAEELRRSEAALRKAQSELAHVTRVTTMGELAAPIAHEVNQPIAGVVINGNACLRWLARVNEESTNLEEAREALQRIIRDANRTGEIVARIRALFKKTEAAKEPLDLDETVREVIVLARTEIERQRIALRLELPPNLPRILGDRVQLQQVMLNLILNAIEAMATVEGRARALVIRAKSRAEGDVLVTVCDSGIGLDTVNGERIFEAFHTTKPTGLGMGLSISRSIVDNHSGRLWVTTNDGPGVSFHFTLPASL
jgi:C4-dicarboxylate-specific signal transduction histidine kinase